MLFLNACEKADFLSLISYLKIIIEFIAILVPIALIIMVGVQLGRIVLGDQKIIPAVTKSIVVKLIAAVAVFFIPTLVNLVMSLLGQVNFSASECWNNANSTTIAHYKTKEEGDRQKEKDERNREAEEARKELERLAQLREEERIKNAESRGKYTTLRGSFESDVIYYNQNDFGNYYLGNTGSTIASSGCGPTSAAVIASSFLGVSGHSPVDAANWICSQSAGYCGDGTRMGGMSAYLRHLGLKVDEYYSWNDTNIDILMNRLASGKYLALIWVRNDTKRGIFTNGGHYFVLTGVQNGELTIAQVSRPWQNEQTWPLSAFDGDAQAFYLVSR